MAYEPDFSRATTNPQAPPARGGFREDGTYWPESSGADHVTRFVRSMVSRRLRDPGYSPADCAEDIAASSASGILGPALREQWSSLTRPEDWRRAHTSNGAQEAVKRCGRDNTKPGHWNGAQWEDGPEGRSPGPLQAVLGAHGWD